MITRFLFTEEEVNFPAEWDKELTKYFKGSKRKESVAKGSGTIKATEGKLGFTFSTFRFIAKVSLATNVAWLVEKQVLFQRADQFAHLFLVLTWNLMCRGENTQKLCYSHMAWLEDAVGVVLPHTKGDQVGDRASTQDPRHIYANPFKPEICPILALGLYFLCHTEREDASDALFPGGQQAARFGTLLRAELRKSSVVAQLAVHGVKPGDLGTHSLRKGASTFVSSGSTAGPSITSICLRCGWSIGGVQDRYIRYERCGDEFCGRCVAGLGM